MKHDKSSSVSNGSSGGFQDAQMIPMLSSAHRSNLDLLSAERPRRNRSISVREVHCVLSPMPR